MVEEKKGKAPRRGQKIQSKRSTPLKEDKRGSTRGTKAQPKGIRTEVKGLLLMCFAI